MSDHMTTWHDRPACGTEQRPHRWNGTPQQDSRCLSCAGRYSHLPLAWHDTNPQRSEVEA